MADPVSEPPVSGPTVSGPTATRERLLAAARDAATRGEWARVRMADVAAAAGVSRQTLYNEFGTKDALAAALALRETEWFIAGADAAVRDAAAATPAELVEVSVRWTLERAAEDPLVKAVLTDDAGGLLPYVTTRAEPVLEASRRQLADHLLTAWPGLDPAAVDLVAEAVVRLTVSYIVLPSDAALRGLPATSEAVAARIARLVTPTLRSAS